MELGAYRDRQEQRNPLRGRAGHDGNDDGNKYTIQGAGVIVDATAGRDEAARGSRPSPLALSSSVSGGIRIGSGGNDGSYHDLLESGGKNPFIVHSSGSISNSSGRTTPHRFLSFDGTAEHVVMKDFNNHSHLSGAYLPRSGGNYSPSGGLSGTSSSHPSSSSLSSSTPSRPIENSTFLPYRVDYQDDTYNSGCGNLSGGIDIDVYGGGRSFYESGTVSGVDRIGVFMNDASNHSSSNFSRVNRMWAPFHHSLPNLKEKIVKIFLLFGLAFSLCLFSYFFLGSSTILIKKIIEPFHFIIGTDYHDEKNKNHDQNHGFIDMDQWRGLDCDVATSAACLSYGYPVGFQPDKVSIIAKSSNTKGVLVKSNLPLRPGIGGVSTLALIEAIVGVLNASHHDGPPSIAKVGMKMERTSTSSTQDDGHYGTSDGVGENRIEDVKTSAISNPTAIWRLDDNPFFDFVVVTGPFDLKDSYGNDKGDTRLQGHFNDSGGDIVKTDAAGEVGSVTRNETRRGDGESEYGDLDGEEVENVHDSVRGRSAEGAEEVDATTIVGTRISSRFSDAEVEGDSPSSISSTLRNPIGYNSGNSQDTISNDDRVDRSSGNGIKGSTTALSLEDKTPRDQGNVLAVNGPRTQHHVGFEKCEYANEVCWVSHNLKNSGIRRFDLVGDSVNPYVAFTQSKIRRKKALIWGGGQRVGDDDDDVHSAVFDGDDNISEETSGSSVLDSGGSVGGEDSEGGPSCGSCSMTGVSPDHLDQKVDELKKLLHTPVTVSPSSSPNNISDGEIRSHVIILHDKSGFGLVDEIAAAYQLKYSRRSFKQILLESGILGGDKGKILNSLMWYCLYLEERWNMRSPQCYDASTPAGWEAREAAE